MYTVADFGRMAASGPRIEAYARAIARVVRPGCTVLDVGSGTGVLALLAAKAGARKVYAVDPNPAIWLLPELAAENGVADRIEIHPISSFDLVLPEKVDVLVSDLRGSFSLFDDHLAAIHDARTRWLKEGGVMISQRDKLRVALVEAMQLHSRLEGAAEAFIRLGLGAKAMRRSIFNSVTNDGAASLASSDLLTDSAVWAEIDYGQTRGSITSSVQLTTSRSGVARGLAVWFEAQIHGDFGFANPPGTELPYARVFLPLPAPYHVASDARVDVTLRVDERGGRWAWETSFEGPGPASERSFKQSTFFGTPTSPEVLLRSSATFAPTRTRQAERYRQVLDLMTGEYTVHEITIRLQDLHPHEPADRLSDEVRMLVSAYGE